MTDGYPHDDPETGHFTDTHPEGYDPIRDGGADYGDDDDYSGEDEEYGYDYDDDGYSQGWNDGYSFALKEASPWYYWTIRQQSRLRRLKTEVRWKWTKFKSRLHPHDFDDIPF